MRTVANGLVLLLPLVLLLLGFLPWQQAALATGRVIAFAQQEREQGIDSPIDGRIGRFLVREGQLVEAGEPLIELRDNDPDRLGRLIATREASERALASIEQQTQSYQRLVDAGAAARDLDVAEQNSEIKRLASQRAGLAFAVTTERYQAERQGELAEQGIVSRRDAELATLARDKAVADLAALDHIIEGARQARGLARAKGDVAVAASETQLQAAQASLADQQQTWLGHASAVQRQESQLILAPRKGVVLRLYNAPGGGQVKEGDRLVTLVPEAASLAVELTVSGSDMPLVSPGAEVRLLFEGWPALQLVGPPGAQAGMYAGRVAFLDATDDGHGKFRVVVVPDLTAAPWPEAARLRQGVRVRGWVLFGRVSLGNEVWRQLNGFPPLPPNG